MKKHIPALSVLMTLSLLTACQSSDDVYVTMSDSSSNTAFSSDLNSLSEDSSTVAPDKPLCNVVVKYHYDGSQNNIMNSMYTFDDNYLYLFKGIEDIGQKVKLNLQSGAVKAMCDVPGCRHSSSECIYNRQTNSIRAFEKEIRYISGNRLMSFNGTKHTTLFTNNIVTQTGDVDELVNGEPAPGSDESFEYALGGCVIAENKTYLFGGNIVFWLDNDTLALKKSTKVGDNVIYSMCAYSDIAYISNDVNELYMIDTKNETVKKLRDKVVNPSVYNERLYYIKWAESVPCLYSASLDGTNEQKVLEDCYVNYVIKDGNAFYSQYSTDKAFYMYSLDKKEKTKLSDIVLPDVITAEYIDRVFAVCGEEIQSWLSADGSDFIAIKYED